MNSWKTRLKWLTCRHVSAPPPLNCWNKYDFNLTKQQYFFPITLHTVYRQLHLWDVSILHDLSVSCCWTFTVYGCMFMCLLQWCKSFQQTYAPLWYRRSLLWDNTKGRGVNYSTDQQCQQNSLVAPNCPFGGAQGLIMGTLWYPVLMLFYFSISVAFWHFLMF